MVRRRRHQLRAMTTQPGAGGRRSRGTQPDPAPRQPAGTGRQKKSGSSSGMFGSIMSLVKGNNLQGLSGQIHGFANGMEKFGQIASIMGQVGFLGGGGGPGKGFNFFNILKNGDSLNHLIQAFLPALGVAELAEEEEQREEIKVEPISIETRKKKS